MIGSRKHLGTAVRSLLSACRSVHFVQAICADCSKKGGHITLTKGIGPTEAEQMTLQEKHAAVVN